MRVLLNTILFYCSMMSHLFAQRIVDQISINPTETVQLYDTMSLEAFLPMMAIGAKFPDFRTITIENQIIDRNQIFESAKAEQKVPVFVMGRPSCSVLRSGYKNVLVPLEAVLGDQIQIIHLANSVEPHSTNGYVTPYYDRDWDNTPTMAPQVPDENVGFSFSQPFTGDELLELTRQFKAKMIETGIGNSSFFQNVTVLIDSPEGGFTDAFHGPSMIWVLNPITGEVVVEKSEFFCGHNEGSIPCSETIEDLTNAIQSVSSLLRTLSVSTPVLPPVKIELHGLNLLGQSSNESKSLLYDPKNKVKYVVSTTD